MASPASKAERLTPIALHTNYLSGLFHQVLRLIISAKFALALIQTT